MAISEGTKRAPQIDLSYGDVPADRRREVRSHHLAGSHLGLIIHRAFFITFFSRANAPRPRKIKKKKNKSNAAAI